MGIGGWAAATISAAGLLASATWAWLLLGLFRYRSRVRWLDEVPDADPPGGWPTLAVVFAARNEAGHVAEAARSMLGQDYPGLLVVAVDDRSADATGAELDALASAEPRLEAVHVRDLPPGWLGKVHALEVGAARAGERADWLLFTDADVVFAPGALRRAVALALADGADHVVVAPDVITVGFGERAFLAMFGLLFAFYAPVWRIEDPDTPSYLGIGAFNLVRAEAFRAIGGFDRLRLSVDDDMRLGQALKAAGWRARVAAGHGLVRVRWQVGLGGMIRGLEKNFFAGARYSPAFAAVASLGILTLGAGPHAGLFVGPAWARVACGSGVLAIAGVLAAVGRQSGISPAYALTLPLSAVLCVAALARSAWLTLARGGVRWRDSFYPLADLRAHARRRDAWVREVRRMTR